MKKRILSIVCVVALIATMISAGAVYAFAGDESTPLEGQAFSLAGEQLVAADWTAENCTPTYSAKGMQLSEENNDKISVVTYKDTYNLTDGFTLTYSAKNRGWGVSDGASRKYAGFQIGNITVYMTNLVTPSIAIDGAAVVTGEAIFGPGIEGWDDSKTYSQNTEAWITSKEGNEITYTVAYDPATKTVSYSKHQGETEMFKISYVDEGDTIDVADAAIAVRHQNGYKRYATYNNITLTGYIAPPPPVALVGTGFEYSSTKPADAEKWTFSHEQAKVNTSGGISLNDAGGGKADNVKATYNDAFTLTRGFELTYTIKGGTTNNYETGRMYFGADVGNISAYLQIADSAKENYKLVIKIDGEDAAASENTAFSTKFSTYFYEPYTFTLSYDAETKTIDYSIAGPGGTASVSYVDTADAVDLVDAVVDFKSNCTWDNSAVYSSAKLVGAKECTQHVYDDENDTDCNVCGAPREPGGPGEPEIIRGEKLTTAWAPEKFDAADWTGHSDKFVDGEFVIPSDKPTWTVWTAKDYDLSEGFTFKGTLAMKNGYNNYYGEWCSAYFGTEDENLELRIKNDSPDNVVKDNTYTAYLLYKGEELASYDLVVLPNGEYEVTYANGKVSVSLGGVAINWTLKAGGNSTAVAVDATETLYKAKLGLRLTGNYCPNGRKWSAISIAPLAKGNSGVQTGDARNLVVPACVMLISAVAAAFVLGKKKVNA